MVNMQYVIFKLAIRQKKGIFSSNIQYKRVCDEI